MDNIDGGRHFSVEELDRHFGNMPDAFFLMKLLLDENGQPVDWIYTYANKAARENVGMERSEFLGKSFFELFGKRGDAKWLRPYYEAAYLGKSCRMEEYSSEVHRFVQVTCFQYEPGYAACFVRDTTRSRLYEKTLQSTTLSYREIYFVDLTQDYYQAVYPSTEAKLERGSYTEAINRHFALGKILDVQQQEVRSFLDADNIRSELAAKDYIEHKYRRLGPDGAPEWCLVSFTAGERDGARPLTAIMTIRSVDEIVRAEQEQQERLQRAVDEAERANRAKSDFLSSMSHDMRTPLNIVIGMATLARLHQDEPEQVQDCMDKIETSGKHLLTLINQVLDMAKIESGEMTLSESPFTMPQLMTQVTQMAHGMIADKHHVLNFRMRSFVHENVIGDEGRLVQVLLNLLSNACKYSDAGTSVVVELEELHSDVEGIGYYRFAVVDSGRGISEEFRNKIFEPFTREEDSRLNKVPGTGLGMTITRQIVEKMGGHISVESELGKGSRFVVEIPLRLQSEQVQPVTFPQERVLVVDDYADCITSICSVLDSMQVRHECAQSGEAALSLLEQAQQEGKPFTCVLVDYRMPGMDGVRLAGITREKYGSQLKVGMVSAYDYSFVKREAGTVGVDFFCPKPVFRSVLLQIFRDMRSAPQHGGSPEAPQGKGHKLYAMVAEDNSINATIAARLLEHLGVNSIIAENGEQAVEMFKKSAPGTFDCIFMDIQMPMLDGLSAARAIRSMPRPDAKLPIFAMTANVFTDDVERTRRAGMQEHIGKPIDLEQLRDVIERWFPQD